MTGRTMNDQEWDEHIARLRFRPFDASDARWAVRDADAEQRAAIREGRTVVIAGRTIREGSRIMALVQEWLPRIEQDERDMADGLWVQDGPIYRYIGPDRGKP